MGAPTTPHVHQTSSRPLKGARHTLYLGDCLQWMESRAPNSVHAIVTDPPYGLKEYTTAEKEKLRKGRGGVWRIPPSFDGCTRSPLPRFTVLTEEDREDLRRFFSEFARRTFRVVVPGGHVFIATNPLLSHLVYLPLLEAGFEKRGEIIRLVQTLRGGDRPKNAHDEFPEVTVMPRSSWEPWGLFRKPCEGRVQDNLRKWKAGGLRRVSADTPFSDVIPSAPTRPEERALAPHPSLKPQAFMRQIVRASLPLDAGVVLDPFMGGGSTIAAAIAVGYESIGIESDPLFFKMATEAIPKLAALTINGNGKGNGRRPSAQLALLARSSPSGESMSPSYASKIGSTRRARQTKAGADARTLSESGIHPSALKAPPSTITQRSWSGRAAPSSLTASSDHHR